MPTVHGCVFRVTGFGMETSWLSAVRRMTAVSRSWNSASRASSVPLPEKRLAIGSTTAARTLTSTTATSSSTSVKPRSAEGWLSLSIAMTPSRVRWVQHFDS